MKQNLNRVRVPDGITEEEFDIRVQDALCKCAAENPSWGCLRAVMKNDFVLLLLSAVNEAIHEEFYPDPEDNDGKILEIMKRAMDRAMRTVSESENDGKEEGNHEEE